MANWWRTNRSEARCFSRAAALVAAVVFGWGAPAAAAEEDSDGGGDVDGRVEIFGTFGFGGQLTGEVQFTEPDDFYTVKIDENGERDPRPMQASKGVGAGFQTSVHPNFSIGGRLSGHQINAHAYSYEGVDASGLLNVDFVPRGKIDLESSPVSVYAQAPFGLTFNFPNDDLLREEFVGDQSWSVRGGLSWNAGLQAGWRYSFASSVAAFFEAGVRHQRIRFRVADDPPNPNLEQTIVGGYTQAVMNLGVSFEL